MFVLAIAISALALIIAFTSFAYANRLSANLTEAHNKTTAVALKKLRTENIDQAARLAKAEVKIAELEKALLDLESRIDPRVVKSIDTSGEPQEDLDMKLARKLAAS